MKTYKGFITELPSNGIFVFGSNTEGRHGKGAALVAVQRFGAIYGRPAGHVGRSYGIVTKDLTKSIHPSVSKPFIMEQIRDLYNYAFIDRPDHEFYVAYQGKVANLNGYTPEEMAEMFGYFLIPDNFFFEEEFAKLLNR